MRFVQITVIVVTVILPSFNAASGVNIVIPRSVDDPELFKDQFTIRHLRAYNVADEERAINLKSFPGVEKFSSLFKTKITPNTLMAWAKKNKSPEYVFDKLKLNKVGTNPFHNPDINIWAAFTRAVSKDPDQAILNFLKQQYQLDDTALAKMLITASGVKHSKTIATDLLRFQMHSWLVAKVHPDEVYKLLSARGTKGTSLNRALWRQYMLDLSRSAR